MFGSICYVHVPKNNRTKLDARAKKCVFISYDTYRKGWRCMDSMTKKSITSRDVVFDEISSWHTGEEISKVVTFPNNSENLKLSSQIDEQVSHNVEYEYQESDESPTSRRNASRSEGGDGVAKRPLKEKRKRIHLEDYEVQLNHCCISSCFFVGVSNEEPKCYEKDKGCLE